MSANSKCLLFFQEFKRKLSPKTLRKQLSRAETQDSTGSLCASQDFDGSDRLSEGSSGTPTKTHKSKSSKVTQPIKSWLSGTSDSGKKSKTSSGSHWHPVQTPNGDTVKPQERNGSVHPMPNDASSNRILKSIEDNHHGDKSVYQAFREKRSPKLKDTNQEEAAGMKPQAVKVVEFPERILNEGQGYVEVSKSASEGHSPSSSSRQQQQPRVTGESQSEAVPFFLSNHGNRPQAFTNNVVARTTIQIDDVVMSPGKIESMSRSLTDADANTDEGGSKASSTAGSPKVSSLPSSLPESLDRNSLRLCHVVDDPSLPAPLQQQHPLVAGMGNRHRTKLEPPRTLNVREVSKLSKGVFTLPSTCMSAESIGPCSLDVSSIGTGKVTPNPPDRGRHWYLNKVHFRHSCRKT